MGPISMDSLRSHLFSLALAEITFLAHPLRVVLSIDVFAVGDDVPLLGSL